MPVSRAPSLSICLTTSPPGEGRCHLSCSNLAHLLPISSGNSAKTLFPPNPLHVLQISAQKSLLRRTSQIPDQIMFTLLLAPFTHHMLAASCSIQHPERWVLAVIASVPSTQWAFNIRLLKEGKKNRHKYSMWLSCVHCGLTQQTTYKLFKKKHSSLESYFSSLAMSHGTF